MDGRRTEEMRKTRGYCSLARSHTPTVMMNDRVSRTLEKPGVRGDLKTLVGRPKREKRGFCNQMARPLITLFVGLLLVTIPGAGGCVSSPKRPVGRPRPNQGGVYHAVKRHQTLWRICKTYKVDMTKVARINGIQNVNAIKAGQKIFIPGAKKALHVDIYIEDLGPSGKKPVTLEPAKVKGRFIWPVRGPIIKRFNRSQARRHDGIDISAPRGTAIKAADAGKVIYSGNQIKGYGNIVIIKHGSIFSSVYAHNAVNLVHEGDRLKKGQVIGRVGRTGRATGPRLHFEIRNHNKPIDPLLVLP